MKYSDSIKKMIVATVFVLLSGSLIILNTGCVKAIWGGGTITIKGKLVKDCSGTPIAGMPLNFYLKSSSVTIGGKSGTIGYDTTDQDGNFSVTGANFGSGSLSIQDDVGDSEIEIDGIDGSTVDLGTIYKKFDFSIAVRFSRPINGDYDTLYYGTSSNYPAGIAIGNGINGHIYHVNQERPGTNLPYKAEMKWVWGIGKADYKKAVDSLHALQNDHRFSVWPGVCKEDTVHVDL